MRKMHRARADLEKEVGIKDECVVVYVIFLSKY